MAEITIEEIDGEADAFARSVNALLDEEAAGLGKPFGGQAFHLRACGSDGKYLGGLSGHNLQGWLFVKYLSVVPEARARGVGRTLMARAEQAARQRGLAGVYLDTYDFQAPEFYEKLGYREIGRLPPTSGHPARIWYAKAF